MSAADAKVKAKHKDAAGERFEIAWLVILTLMSGAFGALLSVRASLATPSLGRSSRVTDVSSEGRQAQ